MTRSRNRIHFEHVDVGSRRAEIRALFQYFMAHPERYTDVLIIAETADGTEIKYVGDDSSGKRLSRLQGQMTAMIEDGEELIK